jgi:predicted solute-binding protein
LDLGEAWHAATNKSLIYSLVATHVRSFKKHPDKIVAFHKELETSFKWSQSYKEEIIEASLKACPCSKATLVQYFKLIEYQLTSKHFQGLNYYSSLHYEA